MNHPILLASAIQVLLAVILVAVPVAVLVLALGVRRSGYSQVIFRRSQRRHDEGNRDRDSAADDHGDGRDAW